LVLSGLPAEIAGKFDRRDYDEGLADRIKELI